MCEVFRQIRNGMLLLIVLVAMGCSDSGSTPQTSVSVTSQSYYDYLTTAKFVDRAEAQPQFPASGELFNENASIFRFTPAKISAKQTDESSSLLSDFAFYTPSSSVKRVSLTVSDAPGNFTSNIPGFKKPDVIPVACSGLSSDELRDCLDNLEISSAPESDHVSQHDLQSLKIQTGENIEEKILSKNLQSLTAQISTSDRTSIINQLTDFTNDDPAHANIDMTGFRPFDRSGYTLSSVIITDNSSSDTDDDGDLDPHSTMITELVKPVAYQRTPSSALNACMVKYNGSIVEDRYVVKLTSYSHLDHLKAQRKILPILLEEPADGEINIQASLQQYEKSLDVMGVNQALDANVIKSIYSATELLPSSSTEYTLMFQMAPDLISGVYSELLGNITTANDSGCQELVEQHINARTAMMSGVSSENRTLQKATAPTLTVFYQVPVFYSQQLTAKFAAALLGISSVPAYEAPLQDYCMVDGNGKKVAIVDPVSGAIVPACEKIDQKSLVKVVMMTKAGACSGDKSAWSYYPSLMRSPRFGRGVQYILTEWLLHNQVGDYKNIHFYQSAWKAGVQVLVRGAKIVASTYFQGQLVSSRFAAAAAPDILFVVDAVMQYTAEILKTVDFQVAKYHFKFPSQVTKFLASGTGRAASNTSSKEAGYAAFLVKLTSKSNKSAALGFLIEKFTDSVAQAIDVEVVGWQDLSDGSHNGCFKFD